MSLYSGSGGGSFSGTVGTTDNAVIRANGTGGAALQGSEVQINDSGAVLLPVAQTVNFGLNSLGYTGGTGPSWYDLSADFTLQHDVQSLTGNHTATWPNRTGAVSILAGGLQFLGYTSSASGASTTELPADKNCSIHKNTGTSAVHLAYNDGGVIKSVQLS